jgi:hypothetical protein
MAYPAGPPGPAEPVATRRRPTVVTVASWLLYLAAVCQVLSAIITLSQLGATKEAYKKVFTGTSMEGAESMLVAITAATAVVIGLLFAVGYVVLAILDGRGKNPARIVTWVVGGLAICCTGYGLVANAAGFTGFGGGSGNAPSGREIQQALRDAYPGWYQPALTAVGTVAIISLLITVVLLALPAANDFFRKPKQQPVWEPPVPPLPPPTA